MVDDTDPMVFHVKLGGADGTEKDLVIYVKVSRLFAAVLVDGSIYSNLASWSLVCLRLGNGSSRHLYLCNSDSISPLLA